MAAMHFLAIATLEDDERCIGTLFEKPVVCVWAPVQGDRNLLRHGGDLTSYTQMLMDCQATCLLTCQLATNLPLHS